MTLATSYPPLASCLLQQFGFKAQTLTGDGHVFFSAPTGIYASFSARDIDAVLTSSDLASSMPPLLHLHVASTCHPWP
ncbi:hypothetical protein E2562_009846 [Oryza meyeriana var. granulata]|uniref:Uncharacterized protein n=1 Tax=Oryza meyeriana var. granulata TaxID=110450 RepID=A0A6G1BTT9_9ORYZ|nr:hypothetical protein E2562_009846 [Oryza meyeriana var. granulata]